MTADQRYDSLLQYFGELHGVPWTLLKAQIRAESNFNPNAKSKVGAKGLAQFMSRTWDEWHDGTPGIGEKPNVDLVLLDPRDPEDCINAQAAYMAWLLKQFKGDLDRSLAAYNFGIGRVKSGQVWPKETQDYVVRINRYYKEYDA